MCTWKIAGFVIFFLTFGICIFVSADNLVPGDVNGDGSVDVSDAVYLVNYALGGGPPPVEFGPGDVNNDCSVDISDAVRIIFYAFDSSVDSLFIGCLHEEVNSGCLPDRSGRGEMAVEVDGYNLVINHINAFYQCCLGYKVDYQIFGDEITAMESDTGAPCDCLCWFDLSSKFYNLEEGEYTVTLIGIEGDTIGTQTVSVPLYPPELVEFSDTGCVDYPDNNPAQDVDYFQVDDTLKMVHHDAYFNCGAELVVLFEQAGDTLRFTEQNISDDYTYCTCFFEVSARVVGLPYGQYVAEIYHDDPFGGPVFLIDRRTISVTD